MRRLPPNHSIDERPALTAISTLNDWWHNQLCADDPQAQRDDREDQPQAESAPHKGAQTSKRLRNVWQTHKKKSEGYNEEKWVYFKHINNTPQNCIDIDNIFSPSTIVESATILPGMEDQ